MLIRRVVHLRALSPGVLGGVALLVIAYLVTSYVVARYRPPGQLSVIEAQAMDMSLMRPPQGSVPVATEVVKRGTFAPSVTYTGTVVAYNDEDIYPRVPGIIVSMPVYPGDRVSRGQLLVRLDDVELSAREREALWEREMTSRMQATLQREAEAAAASRAEGQAEIAKADEELKVAQREAAAAEAMLKERQTEVRQAESELEAARHEVKAMQAAVEKAEAEVAMAEAGVKAAEAEVESASARLTYLDNRLKRTKQLFEAGAVSLEEYQQEEADTREAQAALARAQAMLAERKQALSSAQGESRAANASLERSRSGLAAAEAMLERARAARERAEAELLAAQARVEQARAEVAGARARYQERSAQVGAALSREREAAAAVASRTASLAAARTVRGYTEIRAQHSGYVVQRLVSPGVLVSPGTPILRVADISRVRLQAYVAQPHLEFISVGGRVEVISPKLSGGRLEARVTSVFPFADPAARTTVVEALIDNPGWRLLPGEAVTLRFFGQERSQAITVPSSAIVYRTVATGGPSSRQEPTVWLAVAGGEERTSTIYTCVMHPEVRSRTPGQCPKCGMDLVPEKVTAEAPAPADYTCVMHPEVHSPTPGTCPKCKMELVPSKPAARGGVKKAHRVAVRVGRSDGERTEILAGLREGDEVIYRGHEYLHEGDLVYAVAWGERGPLQIPPAPAAMSMPAGQGHTGHEGGSPGAPAGH